MHGSVENDYINNYMHHWSVCFLRNPFHWDVKQQNLGLKSEVGKLTRNPNPLMRKINFECSKRGLQLQAFRRAESVQA
jgi:hypothetical protein